MLAGKTEPALGEGEPAAAQPSEPEAGGQPEAEDGEAAGSPTPDAEGEAAAPTTLTLAELAKQFDVDEPSLLEQVVVALEEGAEPLPLSKVIEGFRAQPRAAQREAELAAIAAEYQTNRANLDTGFRQRVEELDVLLKATADLLVKDEQGIDWASLKANDPAAYVEQKERVEARRAEFGRIYQQAREYGARAKQGRDGELSAWQKNEHRLLRAKFPELADDARGKAWFDEVRSTLHAAGFADAELNPATLPILDDHRVWLVLRKAADYDRAMAESKKRIAPLRKLPKPVLKSAARKEQLSQQATQKKVFEEDMGRLQKTGDVRDLARLLGAKEVR